MDTFRLMEQLEWNQILTHTGLQMKKANTKTLSKPLPCDISPDVTLYEIRVTQRARIFGYIFNNVFHLVWFDRRHEVYSMS